jgi:CDP-glucose 4,6-dehydratase
MSAMTLDDLTAHYAGRRVFVTGSTGFKGSWLCRMLVRLGADVTGYSLVPPTDPSLFEIAKISGDINQVIGDVRDIDKLRAAFDLAKPETVLHLAAQPLVLDGYADPRYTYEVNVMGTVNVLECARECESVTSLLNVTTDKVYENREIPGYGYREDDKLDGFDPYSNSKSCSELATHSYAQSFFAEGAKGSAAGRCAISTARAGNVIGGGDFSANRIVPDSVRAALSGERLVLRNPNSIRPYQHVLEPLTAYLMIAAAQDDDRSKAGWYNVGPDPVDCKTTGEMADMFAAAWGEGFSWHAERTDGPHEAGLLMLANDKVKCELGWRPAWTAEEAVKRTAEWTRAWQDGQATQCMDDQIDEYYDALFRRSE